MLAADAPHLHQDRRRRHDRPALRGPRLEGRPGHRGLRDDRRAVAALGLARALEADATMAADLLTLQRELFVVGADLATNPKERRSSSPRVSLVTERHGGAAGAPDRRAGREASPAERLHRARARTRRAPRSTSRAAPSVAPSARWSPWSSQREVNPEVRRYLNRLSDLLFVPRPPGGGRGEPASTPLSSSAAYGGWRERSPVAPAEQQDHQADGGLSTPSGNVTSNEARSPSAIGAAPSMVASLRLPSPKIAYRPGSPSSAPEPLSTSERPSVPVHREPDPSVAELP